MWKCSLTIPLKKPLPVTTMSLCQVIMMKKIKVLIWFLFLKVLYAKPRLKEVISLLCALLFEGFLCVFVFVSHLFQGIFIFLYALAG